MTGAEVIGKPVYTTKAIPKGQMQHYFIRILPFLNPLLIRDPLMDLIVQRAMSGIPGYAMLALQMAKAEAVRDERGLRRWKAQPHMKEITKATIDYYLEGISNPDFMKVLGTERAKEFVDEFKDFIFHELDILWPPVRQQRRKR